MGSHKHFEKAGTMYEEVFRIPLIVKLPGAPAQRIDRFARLMDLMPTILELAGVEPPDGIDATSLLPLLRGEQPSAWPDSVYCESHGEVWGYQTQRMVRTRGWKYVYNAHDMDELYDVQGDPWEMDNRIDDPAAGGVLQEMKGRLLGWNDASGDQLQWNWVRWNFPDPIAPL
jgi:arylsulfatase A-like enzyme